MQYDPDPLYIDHGSVVTSAGSAAALDCCLHLVRTDHGASAAAVVARSLVTAPHRAGAQSQFAVAAGPARTDDAFGRLLTDAAADIARIPDVADLASRSAVSRRSLERLFQQRLGTTPRAWLLDQRLQAARQLLEDTDLSVDQIATAVGFGSTPSLRREFNRQLGTTPTQHRRTFGHWPSGRTA